MSDSTSPQLHAEENERKAERPSLFVGFLVVACLALVIVDLVLIRQNRELRAQVGELTQRVESGERPMLGPGDAFPAITLVGGDGAATSLPFQETTTLLLVSSQSCHACDIAKPVWDKAVAAAERGGIRVAGLSLDGVAEELDEVEASYTMFAPGDDVFSLIAQTPGVPAAILIDGDGVVLRSFYGAEQLGLIEALEEVAQQ